MEEQKEKEIPVSGLGNVVDITYLTSENAVFTDEGGYLSLSAALPGESGEIEQKKWERIFLHRMFPFEEPERFLSVLEPELNEIGIIEDLAEFPEEAKHVLRAELRRKYYIQKILQIIRLKDRYGFTYWDVIFPDGEGSFTLQDTQRSIIKIQEDRLLITDIDGNRYEIESVQAMDRASYKRIELYL